LNASDLIEAFPRYGEISYLLLVEVFFCYYYTTTTMTTSVTTLITATTTAVTTNNDSTDGGGELFIKLLISLSAIVFIVGQDTRVILLVPGGYQHDAKYCE
jgi:hypothetical protein